MKNIMLLLALAALSVFSAGATIIDQFSMPLSGQFVCNPGYNGGSGCTNGQTNTATSLGPSVAGGQRTLTIADYPTPVNGDSYAGANVLSSGLLEIANNRVDSKVTVSWVNLGSLVADGSNQIRLIYKTDNHPININFTFNGISYAFNNLQSVGVNNSDPWAELLIPMSLFSGVDFSAVLSASMEITSTNSADVVIDQLETGTPEPMTFGMMGLGLVALGALRLRKK